MCIRDRPYTTKITTYDWLFCDTVNTHRYLIFCQLLLISNSCHQKVINTDLWEHVWWDKYTNKHFFIGSLIFFLTNLTEPTIMYLYGISNHVHNKFKCNHKQKIFQQKGLMHFPSPNCQSLTPPPPSPYWQLSHHLSCFFTTTHRCFMHNYCKIMNLLQAVNLKIFLHNV